MSLLDAKKEGVTKKEVEANGKKVECLYDEEELTQNIVEDHSDKTTQYLAAGIVTIGSFSAGTFLSWTSSALPLLQTDSHLMISTYESSTIAALLNLGAFIGAIPTGLIAERFGRKKTLLSLALTMVVAWLLIALSTSVYCFYVGRFVGGMAVGALSVAVPPYVAELAQPSVRAALAQASQLQLTAGILAGYLAGLVPDVTIISLICAAFPAIYFLGFLFMPESPVYLMSQGKTEEARNSLIYLRGAGCNIDEELKSIKNYIKESISKEGTFKDLVATRSNLKALFIAFALMIFQQLSGISAVIFFLGHIFRTAGVKEYSTVIVGLTQVVSTYLSAMFFTSTGRRPMLIISNLIMGASVATLGVYFHLNAMADDEKGMWIPILCLSTFVSFYSIGVGPIPWLMLREIFPINIKRRATAFSAGLNWLMAFIVTALYKSAVESVGTGWVLCNFGISCGISAIFVYFVVPETKGKTTHQIHNELSRKSGLRLHRHIIEIESISVSSL